MDLLDWLREEDLPEPRPAAELAEEARKAASRFRMAFGAEEAARAIRQTAETGKTDDKAIERSLQLDMVEDEMDKLISLKSMRVGYAIGGLGFIAALISLVMGSPSGVMLNIVFGSFFAGSLIESLAQLVYYRRGIKNS